MKTFDELKVKETIQKGIQELGFNIPTDIIINEYTNCNPVF